MSLYFRCKDELRAPIIWCNKEYCLRSAAKIIGITEAELIKELKTYEMGEKNPDKNIYGNTVFELWKKYHPDSKNAPILTQKPPKRN